MNQRELKERIMSDPDLTVAEKNRMLRDIRAPYYQMSDEELLQLIRDFVAENGRVPERKDLIYAGRTLPEQREEGVEYILDADVWEGEAGTWPAFNHAQLPLMGECSAELKFLFMPYMAQTDEVIACLKVHPEVVVISQSNHPNRLGEHRALVHQLMTEGLENPVVFFQHYAEDEAEDLHLHGNDSGGIKSEQL